MSSFIISQKTMNNIINGLFWNHKFKDIYRSLLREMNLKESQDFEAFGQKLFILNLRAVLLRYQNLKQSSEHIYLPKYIWVDAHITTIQWLKSLECLRYQCSEGNIPRTKLYKWLNKVIDGVQNQIISDLPEYKEAVWN